MKCKRGTYLHEARQVLLRKSVCVACSSINVDALPADRRRAEYGATADG